MTPTRPTFPNHVYRTSRFWLLILAIAMAGFALMRPALAPITPALAQDIATNFINSNYWPVDAGYRYVLAYPDTPWTWSMLGLEPEKGCPPYRARQRAQSIDFWRTVGVDEEQDWRQASRGNQLIPCYRGHAGTDIPTPSGAPVYAAADGIVMLTEINADTEGQGAMIVVDHHRTVAGVDYTWRVRYLHLLDRFPVKSGPVRQGQLIGWTVSQGLNSHLHFEIQNFLDCQDACIQNPWGPVYLWMDDDDNSIPDPATYILAPAPKNAEIMPREDFVTRVDRWLAAGGSSITGNATGFEIAAAEGSDRWATAQTFIPYAVRGGAPLVLDLSLANPTPEVRFAFVTLGPVQNAVNPASSADRIGCLFTIPPHTSGVHYSISGRTERRWANFVLTISGIPDRVDVESISLREPTGSGPRRTRCAQPLGIN